MTKQTNQIRRAGMIVAVLIALTPGSGWGQPADQEIKAYGRRCSN
jgi:hypothetical protein